MSFQCSVSSLSGLHLYFAIFDVFFLPYFLMHLGAGMLNYFFIPVEVVMVLFLNFILRYKIVAVLIFSRTLNQTG